MLLLILEIAQVLVSIESARKFSRESDQGLNRNLTKDMAKAFQPALLAGLLVGCSEDDDAVPLGIIAGGVFNTPAGGSGAAAVAPGESYRFLLYGPFRAEARLRNDACRIQRSFPGPAGHHRRERRRLHRHHCRGFRVIHPHCPLSPRNFCRLGYPLFTLSAAGRGEGLEALAEDGDPSTLAISLGF